MQGQKDNDVESIEPVATVTRAAAQPSDDHRRRTVYEQFTRSLLEKRHPATFAL